MNTVPLLTLLGTLGMLTLMSGGCARSGSTASPAAAQASSPTFRQMRVGDHWQFSAPSPARGRRRGLHWEPPALRYEVTQATAGPAGGARALTIRVTHRYWGGLPGYPRNWQVRSCDFPVRQGADGSMVWDDLQPDNWATLAPIVRQFPPRLRCPLAPGQTYDSGALPLPRGTRQTTWRVVGQEKVVVPMGRFLAWRVERRETIRSEEGKITLRTISTDWYDGNLWLLRRQMRLDNSDNAVLQATKALVHPTIEQIPWEKPAS